jgi:hypothetical protein
MSFGQDFAIYMQENVAIGGAWLNAFYNADNSNQPTVANTAPIRATAAIASVALRSTSCQSPRCAMVKLGTFAGRTGTSAAMKNRG